MLINFVDRPSDSPFIERVWRSQSDRAGVFHSIAACHWVMVVTHLTGYLGGAAATHVIARSGTFPTAFAIGFGVLVWVGLVLREPRLIRWILQRQG